MIALFLDNNVLIGYIFETDHWNSKSMEVMSSTPRKLSSDTVKRECSEIYDKNIRIIRREFQRTIAEINRSPEPEKLSLPDTYYSKDILAEFFKSNPEKDKAELMQRLRRLLRDTESRCLSNLQLLEKMITFCTRDKPYSNIYRLLEADGLVQIDPLDVEIIIDAHHAGLQVSDLFLITGDYEYIMPRRNLIKSSTSLKDVVGLGEYCFK